MVNEDDSFIYNLLCCCIICRVAVIRIQVQTDELADNNPMTLT